MANPITFNDEQVYLVRDVAKMYDVSVHTVQSWVRLRKLGAVKIGKNYLIPASGLRKFEMERTTTEK